MNQQVAVLEGLEKFVLAPSPELVPPSSLKQQITDINQTLEQLLPVEASSKTAFYEKVSQLKAQAAKSKYSQLSLEALQLRNEKGEPRFALFDTEHTQFTIGSDNHVGGYVDGWDWRTDVTSRYPRTISDCYADVVASMQAKIKSHLLKRFGIGIATMIGSAVSFVVGFMANIGLLSVAGFVGLVVGLVISLSTLEGDTIAITATYTGLMPKRARTVIQTAKNQFDRVFLLAQVENWQEARVKADPLVLGYVDGELFILDKFDTTPAEEYLADEFATS